MERSEENKDLTPDQTNADNSQNESDAINELNSYFDDLQHSDNAHRSEVIEIMNGLTSGKIDTITDSNNSGAIIPLDQSQENAISELGQFTESDTSMPCLAGDAGDAAAAYNEGE